VSAAFAKIVAARLPRYLAEIDDRHALPRRGLPSISSHAVFHPESRVTAGWKGQAVLRVPLNGDGPQCTSAFQTFGRDGWMEMDMDKSRGIRKEIPIRDCDTIGEWSRFIPGDSVAMRDLEVTGVI